ncbi:MAG: glycoside hydrolase family 10 protein, partial [Phycisphaerae bacterium]
TRPVRMGARLGTVRLAAAVGLVTFVLLASGCHPGGVGAAGSIRAMWVTRWDYKTPGDIAAVMENCRWAGFNTVLFQVRGNGTALYRSKIEPWAKEFGGRDPGFDPLAVACREAKRRGLDLHAWVNVMPGWRGKAPPTDRRQLYHTHPDWFWRDAWGRRQPLGWYNSLNPCYPEVRRYIVAVMHEIVAGYPVDGLHLDYIRFPNEWNNAYPAGVVVPDYPRDPRTLAMFRRATGTTPDRAPARWNAWRTDQVTQLVRDIAGMVRHTKPRVRLTAAVGPVPADAKRRHFQDALRWIDEGLVDAVFPMNYTAGMDVFNARLAAWRRAATRVPVVVGVSLEKGDPPTVAAQVERACTEAGHVAAFAYSLLFERRDTAGRPIFDAQSEQRAALRHRVASLLRARHRIPVIASRPSTTAAQHGRANLH